MEEEDFSSSEFGGLLDVLDDHHYIRNPSLSWEEREFDPHIGSVLEERRQVVHPPVVDVDEQANSETEDINFFENVHLDGFGFEVPSTGFEDMSYFQFSEFTGLEEEIGDDTGGMYAEQADLDVLLQQQPPSILDDGAYGHFGECAISVPDPDTENENVESSQSSQESQDESVDLDLALVPVSGNNEMPTEDISTSSDETVSKCRDMKKIHDFMKGWRFLEAKIRSMNQRTGCKTYLEAVFENSVYVINSLPCAKDTTNPQAESQEGGEIVDAGSSSAEGDHRYAAVILTQKESSPSVRDHQYSEFTSQKETPATTIPSEFLIGHRGNRECHLAKCLKAIFIKKQTLEETTGASIKLQVNYETETFTSINFESAYETLKVRRWRLFPTRTQPIFKIESPQILVGVNRTPILDGSSPIVRIQYVREGQDSPYDHVLRRPICYGDGNFDLTGGTQNLQLNSSLDNYDSTENLFVETISSSPVFQDENENSGSGPPSVSTSIINAHSPREYFGENENNGSEERIGIGQSGSGKSVETMTEIICNICCNSNNHEFWLRCANAKCFSVVHAFCVGFLVQNELQVQMLPPYFCTEHRKELN